MPEVAIVKHLSLGPCMRYRVPPALLHDTLSETVTDAAPSKHERDQWRLWSCEDKLIKLTRETQERGDKVPDMAEGSCMDTLEGECVHPSLWTVDYTGLCTSWCLERIALNKHA